MTSASVSHSLLQKLMVNAGLPNFPTKCLMQGRSQGDPIGSLKCQFGLVLKRVTHPNIAIFRGNHDNRPSKLGKKFVIKFGHAARLSRPQ